MRTLLTSMLLCAWSLNHAATPVFEIAALRTDNALVLFSSNALDKTRVVSLAGTDTPLIGIDIRPQDGKLYGLSQSSTLYTLDAQSGEVKRVSRLGTAFRGAFASGFDVNPQADRLRLVASGGQNLRVNMDVGAVAIDGALAYASDDRHAGLRPHIVAEAYTQSIANARSTVLFGIDAARDTLVKQDPPNDGVLLTIGKLGIDCDDSAGFDIATVNNVEHALAICGMDLISLNLKTGAAQKLGRIATDNPLVGMAILRAP